MVLALSFVLEGTSLLRSVRQARPTAELFGRDVIEEEATEGEMHWIRWSDWTAEDPRWRVRVLDTSGLPVEHVANELAEWIAEERARRTADD